MSNSDWLDRTRSALWHPCTQMKQLEALPPLPIARGEGPWLIDYDGRRYLDAISSWWVNLFGHAEPRIRAAIVDQLQQIEHVILAGCTHAPVVELSERLAGLSGLGHAFYASDGASATEIALKMSFHYWRNSGYPDKTGFVSLKHGYHGETLGALSVTDVALFKDTYAPLLRHSHQAMSPDWRLAEPGESPEAYARRAADDLAEWLAEQADHTAAIIVEPLVQCAAGMAMHHPAYLRQLRTLCDRHHVHLIADEIAVGFGRTGTLFAHEQASLQFTDILAQVAAHPRVRHFRHLGMIWAFDVADAAPGFAARFHQAALAQGVFIRPIGNTVYVMPPYITGADPMRGLADTLRICLDDPAV
jgi:adenosylmethionine---8-amino-7-oxononanoate aminotransferase